MPEAPETSVCGRRGHFHGGIIVSPTKPRAPERHLLSQADLQRVQGAVARKGGGEVPKGSYVGRMQRHIAQVSRKGTK